MAQLLTLDQALADIASFIPHFNRLHGLENARWVAFGGSYAGSLAAWFRVKYPQLTVGAVASSAPIWPKVDFWGLFLLLVGLARTLLV
jgi:pimeloyl-ACP methyl ester carboxylesterase